MSDNKQVDKVTFEFEDPGIVAPDYVNVLYFATNETTDRVTFTKETEEKTIYTYTAPQDCVISYLDFRFTYSGNTLSSNGGKIYLNDEPATLGILNSETLTYGTSYKLVAPVYLKAGDVLRFAWNGSSDYQSTLYINFTRIVILGVR